MPGGHVHPVGVVEQPIPGLADHGQGPEEGSGRLASNALSHKGIADDAHRVGIGDRNDPAEHARFPNPLEAGHLAVAIEDVRGGEHGFLPDIAPMWNHHRDPGPDRANSHLEWPVAFDDRGVTDPDTRHVRDRIQRTRRHRPDDDAQVSSPRVTGLGHGQSASASIAIVAIPR